MMSRITRIHAFFLLGIGVPAAALATGPCDKPVVKDNLITGQRSITFHTSLGSAVFILIYPFFEEVGGKLTQHVDIAKEKPGDPNGYLESVFDGPVGKLDNELGQICTDDWVKANLTEVVTSPPSGPAAHLDAAASSPSSGQASEAIALADFNGDSHPDSIVLSPAGAVIKLRAADGSILSTRTFGVGFSPDPSTSQVVAADFNGDGKLDLAVSNFGQLANFGQPTTSPGGISILLGNGDGTFGVPRVFPAGPNPLSLAAADFNGDGKIDIAVANTGGTVSMLLGNGDGTLGAPSTVVSPGGDPFALQSILAVDLNGDGAPDIALANYAESISVLLNSGGKFGQPIVTSIPFIPRYLAYSDLNHDGRLDYFLASRTLSSSCKARETERFSSRHRMPTEISRNRWE